jgi:transposase-like protein
MECVLELLTENGFGAMAKCMEILMNEAMRHERSAFIGAGPYQRSEERRGYANGYKPKRMDTRAGEVELKIPQVRGLQEGDERFYPQSLDQGPRGERALMLAVAESYVQGVSTRKVAAITEKLCGLNITSMQVSRAAKLLDDELEAWRNRAIGKTRYLTVDAKYVKVRHSGSVLDVAVLIAVGVMENGKRSILGVSVALSEAETHWRDFIESLQNRGLHGIELITSDKHSGLIAAMAARFPTVPWQRCQFHLQQNAQAHVPKVAVKDDVARSIRAIFNAMDRANADRLLRETVHKYQADAPELTTWMEENIPESLAVFAMPPKHQKKLRTSNSIDRLNLEVSRRVKVVGVFPNVESLLRLVSALLAEKSEEWETGRIYLDTGQD